MSAICDAEQTPEQAIKDIMNVKSELSGGAVLLGCV